MDYGTLVYDDDDVASVDYGTLVYDVASVNASVYKDVQARPPAQGRAAASTMAYDSPDEESSLDGGGGGGGG